MTTELISFAYRVSDTQAMIAQQDRMAGEPGVGVFRWRIQRTTQHAKFAL